MYVSTRSLSDNVLSIGDSYVEGLSFRVAVAPGFLIVYRSLIAV
ncbi:hypothetical protein J2T13_004455 [Paenibacillus sp. DS2015]